MSEYSAADIAGVWHLTGWLRITDGDAGAVKAQGRLFYHPDGEMSVIIAREGGDGPGHIAYSGQWSLADGTIHHDIMLGSDPAMPGQRMTRRIISLDSGPGLLRFSSPPYVDPQGRSHVDELSWRRASG